MRRARNAEIGHKPDVLLILETMRNKTSVYLNLMAFPVSFSAVSTAMRFLRVILSRD